MRKSNSKLAPLAAMLATTLLSTGVQADEFTANVGATSNYLWRGMEQTDGQAAISGGLDYASKSGFYAGTWASNADWAPGMTYELDIYGGFAGELTSSVSYDVGFIYYAYPDEDTGDADFSEIYGSLSFSGVTLGLAVLADGTGADFGDTLYASADYEYALTDKLSMALHLGSYSGDWLADDTLDYGFSLSHSGFTFGVSDTDIDGDDTKVYLAYTIDFEL
jgi:uncharacterized protein (TIGR02001 family)